MRSLQNSRVYQSRIDLKGGLCGGGLYERGAVQHVQRLKKLKLIQTNCDICLCWYLVLSNINKVMFAIKQELMEEALGWYSVVLLVITDSLHRRVYTGS